MRARSTSAGLVVALVAAMTFGTSGAFIKPLLESGWSPAAAVTVRALVGGILLSPFAIVSLRGRWSALWRARWRVLLMALIGVSGTQLAYFAALEHIHVGTAILFEYLAPILLVGWVWVRSRRRPRAVVIVGSAVAIGGLILVVGPAAFGGGDPIGFLWAAVAMVGCAIYYVIAAAPSDDLPPVAYSAAGLVIGGIVLGGIGATGLLPMTFSTADVELGGIRMSFLVPLAVVGLFATAVAYVASITATEMLGSRLASFVGLLEVCFATLYAWLLLGESLSLPQLAGGALILVGIGLVRADRSEAAVVDAAAAAVADSASPVADAEPPAALEATDSSESAPPTEPVAVAAP